VPATSTPDTIVLVHGFWVTPRSWEQWVERYERKGFHVLAPAYPGFDVEVEALNADPTPIEHVTVPQIVGHLEAVIGELGSIRWLPIGVGVDLDDRNGRSWVTRTHRRR